MKIDTKKTLAQNTVEIFSKIRKGRSLGLKDWEAGLLKQASQGAMKGEEVTFTIRNCFLADNEGEEPDWYEVFLNDQDEPLVKFDDDTCDAFIVGYQTAMGWTDVLIKYDTLEAV